MSSSLRELRQRRQSVSATKKITRAMELIAASRVIKAQNAARATLPYTRELNRAVSAVVSHTLFYERGEHPLTQEVENPRRVALLLLTSDRGMNGAYSTNAIKTASRVSARMRERGMEVKRYVVGRKGITYLNFRKLPFAQSWEGFSDAPTYAHAKEIADVLIQDFATPYEEGGVDEIHAVYTRMESMITQTPRVRRLLPLEVVEGVREIGEGDIIPSYKFEPDATTVLEELMPLYIRNRVWFYLLQASASQLASQQRAMKAATDNAEELIQDLTRRVNQARQAVITQEISEIVGGASALAEATAQD